MYAFEIGDLVKTPISYEGNWRTKEYGIVVDYEHWGQGDVYIIVLMQKNNKRCNFHPTSLEKAK